jgi:predicted nucleotide-binding protein (sugar kinase/HSP70/actin superfamily)
MSSCSGIKPHNDSNTSLNYLGTKKTQWRDTINKSYTKADKKDTIMLFGGTTILQDKLIMAAVRSLGENYVALPNPDFESFRKGKAFGNRGQCNPTYFTVGNLVKYLQNLQNETGMSSEEIVQKYLFVTAGGCGPCRFGMYITEYRKSLKDAGFEGFRVMSFQHNKGIFQAENDEESINFSPIFFITMIKAAFIGDIINLLTYKIRPYEVEKGSTDKAVERCYEILTNAFKQKKNLVLAMWRCRKILEKVKLDRLQPKAKVMVMGEFWAAMTEGDGNYNLHRFLESEGAECIPQPVMNRFMLSIWEAEYTAKKVEDLEDKEMKNIDFSNVKTKVMLKLAKAAAKTYFTLYAKAIGLHDYEIPDIEALSKLSKVYYPLDAEGGEGHLEVAHLLESVKHNLSHLVISVKPFGCMPSSAVSDGIQSLVTSHYPSANFLSIETSGEGAANFYSRVQMALFKAKQSAKEEFETLEIPKHIPEKVNNYLYQPKNDKAGTAAQLLFSLHS